MDGEDISSGSEVSDSGQRNFRCDNEAVDGDDHGEDAELDYDEDNARDDGELETVIQESSQNGACPEQLTGKRENINTEVMVENATAISSDDEESCTDHTVRMVEGTDDGKQREKVKDVDVANRENSVDGQVKQRFQEDENEGSEEGEIDDLEEGELKSDNESDNISCRSAENEVASTKERHLHYRNRSRSPDRTPPRDWSDETPQGICKFFLRGTCTWGADCKFYHPREGRQDNCMPAVSSTSSESTWPNDRGRTRARSREKVIACESVHSRVTYASPAELAETAASRGDESAWERGLRQARELMKKASKKREEEPDFENKRLVLPPSDDNDRRRTTDDESDDDSRYDCRRRPRVSRSPSDRTTFNVDQRMGSFSRRSYGDETTYGNTNDIALGRRGNSHERFNDFDRRYGFSSSTSQPPRRIPSLIDSIKEGRIVAPRGTRERPPKIDLGPQVLYPNGRPNRRRDYPQRSSNSNRSRNLSPSTRYVVTRRESRSPRTVSRSPRTSSLSPRSSRSPIRDCRKQFDIIPRRTVDRLDASSTKRNYPSGGEQIRDPWERNRAKRADSHELASTTLGSVLQKVRQAGEGKGHDHKRGRSDSRSAVSSVSDECQHFWFILSSAFTNSSLWSSTAGSSPTSSRTSSRSSSHDRRKGVKRSLAAAVPLKSLFDDDGSIRQTDLSSFRIPKKKRAPSSEVPPRHPTAGRRNSNLHTDSPLYQRTKAGETTKRHEKSIPRRGEAKRKVHVLTNPAVRVVDEPNRHSKLNDAKENVSSDESSSSNSSSTSDDNAEPAAYRRRRRSASDDGLPTEGIPLSPEPAAEEISSDEEEEEGNVDNSKASSKHSQSLVSSEKMRGSSPHLHVQNVCTDSEPIGSHRDVTSHDDDDYVDSETGKEERRAELLRQLKCVDEAIARKRSHPIV
ncbi:hypothetical protein AB6A40_001961 [Gnathostoma spinigerum]|uniref:C3H1-type domain-containing protein n=1 Tax=Gnathostoma spinigerum TaxID=75299 RepID=A0ABD6E7K1_9BILA